MTNHQIPQELLDAVQALTARWRNAVLAHADAMYEAKFGCKPTGADQADYDDLVRLALAEDDRVQNAPPVLKGDARKMRRKHRKIVRIQQA